jgi:hypothetical protein
LRKATEKEVVNVVRYYYYKTIRVRGEDDNVYKNVHKGLEITKATNYKPRGLIISLNTSRVYRTLRKSQSNNTARQKRLSSYTNTLLLLSKCTCSSSLTKDKGNLAEWDQVYCCVILSDYRKPIYKASS